MVQISVYKRYIQRQIESAMHDTPAIMIVGPRQCGKTTLLKQLLHKEDYTYVTLDDLVQFEFARDDPIGFIRHFGSRPIIIDEIQRAPQLMLPIKQAIDEQRLPGRFLMSGSANAMALPRVADSLAGRMETIRLHPLTECEIEDQPATLLPQLLQGTAPHTKRTRQWQAWVEKAMRGGFPEMLSRPLEARRRAWCENYITSIVQKDLRDIAEIEHIHLMPRLIQALAEQVGQITNLNDVANRLQIPRPTISRYTHLLEQLFLFETLPAWHGNTYKRLIKSAKMHIADTGILSYLKHITLAQCTTNRHTIGSILENYVVCEIKKLASFLDQKLYFYHYRDKDKVEVDLVIETVEGHVIGIEVKASATIQKSDFNGLQKLKQIAGDAFLIGLVLYDGDHTNAFGEGLYASPIGCLWT